jgi:hypothetical protein
VEKIRVAFDRSFERVVDQSVSTKQVLRVNERDALVVDKEIKEVRCVHSKYDERGGKDPGRDSGSLSG